LIRYGDLYTAKNVAISGTHTHSGPGGYLQYVLYLVTSLGFVRQSFEALAYGIELAIVEAHENLRPGSVFLNKGKVNPIQLHALCLHKRTHPRGIVENLGKLQLAGFKLETVGLK